MSCLISWALTLTTRLTSEYNTQELVTAVTDIFFFSTHMQKIPVCIWSEQISPHAETSADFFRTSRGSMMKYDNPILCLASGQTGLNTESWQHLAEKLPAECLFLHWRLSSPWLLAIERTVGHNLYDYKLPKTEIWAHFNAWITSFSYQLDYFTQPIT